MTTMSMNVASVAVVRGRADRHRSEGHTHLCAHMMAVAMDGVIPCSCELKKKES